MTKKYVLITGCSEGGLATSMIKVYLRRNYTVLATLRNISKAGALHRTENVQVLQLDITSSDSIKNCVEEVNAITGGTLDVLVNNAAVAQVMPLLDFSIEEAKRHFDTNVWGMLAMVQAFAPMLIKAQGIVCNISSVLGEMVYAWQGWSHTNSHIIPDF
jgi:NAD(P)-dependent dehydrogenase (short-subunit alcohol dehydrogenase family)